MLASVETLVCGYRLVLGSECSEWYIGDCQRTARLNMPGFSALLKSLPSATLA